VGGDSCRSSGEERATDHQVGVGAQRRHIVHPAGQDILRRELVDPRLDLVGHRVLVSLRPAAVDADAQIAANETTFLGSDDELLAALEARLGQPVNSERS
jgi:hypothetical protein